MFVRQQVEPSRLLRAGQLAARASDELTEERRMRHPRLAVVLRGLRQALRGVIADRLQHEEPRLAVIRLDLPHEALVHERSHAVEGVEVAAGGDRLRRLEREPAAEHREPAEEPLLGFVEQVVAPGDRAAERLLALREVARAAREQLERLPQARQDRLGLEELHARRRELDRERKPVEPVGDLRDRRGVRFGRLEPGLDRAPPVDEQPHRLVLRELCERGEVAEVGQRERRHPILGLAADTQCLPAAHQHLRPFGSGEKLANARRRVGDLLEVVEDQKELLAAQVVDQHVQHRAIGVLAEAQRAGDRRHDQLGIGDRRQRHEPGAVRQCLLHRGGDLDREAGLAGPTGPGERQQPRPLEQPADLGDLGLATDEGRELGRDVADARVLGPRRREVRGEVLEDQLREVFGMVQVLQAVLPQVPKRDTLGKAPLHQRARGIGEQDLPTVARGGDAGGAVHVDADVVVAAERRLTGVHAHTDADLHALGPGVGRERTLRLRSSRYRLRCVREDHEERVSLGRDLHTLAGRERGAHQRSVVVQNPVVGGAEALEQLRAPLDVGEQECDGSRGQLGRHATSSAAIIAATAARRRSPRSHGGGARLR